MLTQNRQCFCIMHIIVSSICDPLFLKLKFWTNNDCCDTILFSTIFSDEQWGRMFTPSYKVDVYDCFYFQIHVFDSLASIQIFFCYVSLMFTWRNLFPVTSRLCGRILKQERNGLLSISVTSQGTFHML